MIRVLEVTNLTRSGLSPVSFTLSAGEIIAIQGPSGAGKSLLLRALADLDPNEGQLCLNAIPRASLSGPDWRRRVGYVPAEPGWWADRVGDHFDDFSKIVPWATRLGLAETAAEWPVSRASTGEKARLALLRALAIKPLVLLLDEPTAALDPQSTLAVETLLAEQLADGMAMIWVTHNESQARRVSKRWLRMEAGMLTEPLL